MLKEKEESILHHIICIVFVGTEYLIGINMMMQPNYKTVKGWCWVFGQFVFSLIAWTLLLYHGPMGIIIAPFVFWKFGYPETIMLLYQSFYTASDKIHVSYNSTAQHNFSNFVFILT